MTLGRLAPQLVGIPAKAPQCREAAHDLDRRIEAESDQRDTTGEEPSDQRREAFERVPRYGDVLQPAAAMRGRCPQFCGIRDGAVRDVHLASAPRPPSSSRTSA